MRYGLRRASGGSPRSAARAAAQTWSTTCPSPGAPLEAADEGAAARELGDTDLDVPALCGATRHVGRESRLVEGAEDRDGRQVGVGFGESEPVPSGLVRRAPLPEDEPVAQEPALPIADRDGALQKGEPPRLAARDPARRKRVDEDEPGVLVHLDVDRLAEGRPGERDRLIGHPL